MIILLLLLPYFSQAQSTFADCAHMYSTDDEAKKECYDAVRAKAEEDKVKAECESHKADATKIRQACAKAGISKDCVTTLSSCSEFHNSIQRSSRTPTRTSTRKAEQCSFLTAATHDDAKDAFDDAKDAFESSEEKMQDLQKDLQKAQEDALKQQQSTEEQITQLQNELNEIPLKANQLALKNEAQRDKTLLDHIDNMNKLTDALQEITDQIHDAETQLENKRNELLSQCELEARGKQQAKIAEKNQKKATGSYTVNSLSTALTTSYTANSNGKKVLRNTKEIIERYERCQKTRMYQTGIQAAERNFQRNLIGLESRRKSLEKQHNSLNAKLESSLKMNNKASELEMAGLAREQSSKAQQVMMLQKQLMENQQQAQSNIQQIQQNIQKAQVDQYQKMSSMAVAQGTLASSTSRRGGKLKESDLENIYEAIALVNSGEETTQFTDDLIEKCRGAGVPLGISAGSN